MLKVKLDQLVFSRLEQREREAEDSLDTLGKNYVEYAIYQR